MVRTYEIVRVNSLVKVRVGKIDGSGYKKCSYINDKLLPWFSQGQTSRDEKYPLRLARTSKKKNKLLHISHETPRMNEKDWKS